MAAPNATAPVLTIAASAASREPAHGRDAAPKPAEGPAGLADARLLAVVHLDMVGYSKLVELDEPGTLTRLRDVFDGVLRPLAVRAGGRVANTAGDSALLVFPGAGAAVRFALAFQEAMAEQERTRPADRAMRFRVGVTVADVLESGGADVHGDGVNVAARLQSVCPPGAVCVSRGVRDQVQGKLDAVFEPLGALQLKNIARPVDAYLARAPGGTLGSRRWRTVAGRIRRRARRCAWMALPASALLVGSVGAWQARRVAALSGAMVAAPASATALPDLSVKHAPRLSLVVLPFANTSGDPGQDYLADAVTDDLTTDLSRMAGAFTIGRGSAQTYRGHAVDARRIGDDLGVRYVIQGSVRRVGDGMVRVNAELVSTETGEGLWAERFDQDVRDLGQGQGDIVRRLALALGARLVDVEARRSEREHPDDPDVFDLILRARALRMRPTKRADVFAAEALYERALEREPNSVMAMTGLAQVLIAQNVLLNEARPGNVPRAERLLAAAEAISPGSLGVVQLRARVRRAQERWEEAIAGYDQVIEADPNAATAYAQIGVCRLHLGQPDAAISAFKEALRRDPRHPDIWTVYTGLGLSFLRLQQPADAVAWLRRALEDHSERDAPSSLSSRLALTSALAHAGQTTAARAQLAGVLRLAPYLTARSYEARPKHASPGVAHNIYVAEGLRLAGLRDHVDEDADAGVPSTGDLHPSALGPTPVAVPGAEVIRTGALQRLVAEQDPVILDTYMTGRSLPGAVVLGFGFSGGSLDDAIQDRLRRKMQALTGGDLTRPVVAMGWNAERWGSRNLALRLAALGYTRVHWYRGGKEAWEAQDLPETGASAADW